MPIPEFNTYFKIVIDGFEVLESSKIFRNLVRWAKGSSRIGGLLVEFLLIKKRQVHEYFFTCDDFLLSKSAEYEVMKYIEPKFYSV